MMIHKIVVIMMSEILSNNVYKKNYKHCQKIKKEHVQYHQQQINKKLINQDKICDCGKDIGKMSNQQVEMHMRSKFHNENI